MKTRDFIKESELDAIYNQAKDQPKPATAGQMIKKGVSAAANAPAAVVTKAANATGAIIKGANVVVKNTPSYIGKTTSFYQGPGDTHSTTQATTQKPDSSLQGIKIDPQIVQQVKNVARGNQASKATENPRVNAIMQTLGLLK